MAEEKRSSTTTTANKTRKSRNEIIRSVLGMYLKQRNHTPQEKFRKSDLALTQTPQQMIFGIMLSDDTSRLNSILYSNVMCLSNNPATVDQHFQRFHHFIQSQTGVVKRELHVILNPLLCHLYIELLKGSNSRPAVEFLHKFAHIVAPVDDLQAPLSNRMNGSLAFAADGGENAPTGTSQITFLTDVTHPPPNDDYFKELVQALSVCMRVEELDSFEITSSFHTSKYDALLSLQSIYALQQFLAKNGHVLILHTLQGNFFFDINEAQDEMDDELAGDVDMEEPTGEVADILGGYNIRTLDQNCRDYYNAEQHVMGMQMGQPMEMDEDRKLLKLKRFMERCYVYESPSCVLTVNNADDKLCSGSIDPEECHLACGFDDSVIRLWSLNKTTRPGRRPYRTFSTKTCEWATPDYWSSDDDDENNVTELFRPPHKSMSRRKKWNSFRAKRCNDNSFSSDSGLALRGHSKGVTDVIFSKHYPILMSVSKDKTMRLWKASDYTCGAVYRGHQYPIWCLAESPLGSYMATGARDLTARLWTTDRNFPLQTYIGHTQDVDSVAFHPNGNYLGTGSTDLTVRLWCVTSGKLMRVFTECRLPVHCISFSPDGKMLAAAGEESKIRIFDLAAGSQLGELKDHTASVVSIAWSSDSKKFASSCTDGSLRIWDVSNIHMPDPPCQSSIPSTSSAPPPPPPCTATSTTKLITSMDTGCKRTVRVQFNTTGNVSCIGNT